MLDGTYVPATPASIAKHPTHRNFGCYRRWAMRLIQAEVSGYRRFAAKETMDLDGALICIIGPNSAGKTSFLRALTHLNNDREFTPSERTRTLGGTQSATVSGTLRLDDEDQAALSEIPEAREAELFTLTKHDDASITTSMDPNPPISLDRRNAVHELLQEFLNSRRLKDADKADADRANAAGEAGEEMPVFSRTLTERAAEATEGGERRLAEEQTVPLQTFKQRLVAIRDADYLGDGKDLPAKYEAFDQLIDDLIEYETGLTPSQRARAILRERVPQIIEFRERDRGLGAIYSLDEEPDQAIQNLLALAGSSWEELVRTVDEADPGRVHGLQLRLNEALAESITEAWNQVPLTVEMNLDGRSLRVLMRMQANDWILINEQSDGLRQFVALRAFVALHSRRRSPILLIDEAEGHLHYDAQADLVSVFEEQQEAVQIVYSTHSAGCLPRDIGLGLRAIQPIYEEPEDGSKFATDHSRVVNEFWFDDFGFNPMLIAMGANAFAFSAAKKAVITEGFTDALLLPELVRQAYGDPQRTLAYQIVPHFSRVSKAEVKDLELVAGRVAYLVDGDPGGQEKADHLTDNGAIASQVFALGGFGSDLTLEDLIEPGIFCEVCNALLRSEQGLDLRTVQLEQSDVSSKRRMKKLKDWCKGKTGSGGQPLRAPGKEAIARKLLERRDEPLLDPRKAQLLKDLDRDLKAQLARPIRDLVAEAAAADPGEPGDA